MNTHPDDKLDFGWRTHELIKNLIRISKKKSR